MRIHHACWHWPGIRGGTWVASCLAWRCHYEFCGQSHV
jgi:hypothetical protein